MNSKYHPNCNACGNNGCKGQDNNVFCDKYISTWGTFKFPELISRISTFKNPSKTQLALREFMTARV